MRNCERHHFSLASASMEYTFKNNLPLVSRWTQDIWTKFCAWLMDESEPDAIVLEEGRSSPTPTDRLVKAYIQSNGEYYSGWYKLIGFDVPVPLTGGRMAAGIYCNAGESHECPPFVTMADGSDSIPLDELDGMSRDAVVGAMLSEVEGKEPTDGH